jgi:hypothetical protein
MRSTAEGRDIEMQSNELEPQRNNEPQEWHETRSTMGRTEPVDRSTRTDNGAMKGQSVVLQITEAKRQAIELAGVACRNEQEEGDLRVLWKASYSVQAIELAGVVQREPG